MTTKDAVVKRFENILKERGITKNELAVVSGVTPSSVYSMFDSRRQDVSILTIKKLCDGLDISLSEFFNGEELKNLEQHIK